MVYVSQQMLPQITVSNVLRKHTGYSMCILDARILDENVSKAEKAKKH